jgi:predicted nucleic acid-binding protein
LIVVDASAVIARLAGRPGSPDLARRLDAEPRLHAPHLLDVEFLSAILGLVLGGKMGPGRASSVRRDFRDLALVRYGHAPLADRMWSLRDSLSAYDAAYVALASLLDATLVTCDARVLAGAGRAARVEVFAAS